MAKEPVITVASTEKDTYGNLKVTDNLGNEYKVGEKRKHLHELFIQGRAVKLTWDNYKGKDYISDAELFDGKPPEEKQVEKITGGVNVPQQKIYAPQEIGMWYNNLGAGIRDGSIERDFPKSAVKIKSQYYKKMFEVTGIEKE